MSMTDYHVVVVGTDGSSLAAPTVARAAWLAHHDDADLVIVQRKGRERWNHLNALPIKRIHDRWIGPYAAHAAEVIDKLDLALS